MSNNANKSTEQVSLEALELYKTGQFETQGKIVRHLLDLYPHITKDALRIALLRRVQRHKRLNHHPALATECDAVGLPLENVSNYWFKGKQYSIHVKGEKGKSYEEIRDEIVQSMNEHSPKYETIIRSNIVDGHLLVVDPADIHIGKLASSFETGED
jgi:hypothetical protein